MSFREILSYFQHKRVLVIGEAMLDCYITGDAERLCREGPVPIVKIANTAYYPGGAANTAVNVAMLGADVSFVSVVGKDEEGKKIRKILQNTCNVAIAGVISDATRKTISKERIYAYSQLLLRVDSGSITQTTTSEEYIITYLIKHYTEFDCIIVSDYEYGILTPFVLETLKKLQETFPKIFIVDAKCINKYVEFPATLIKANYNEALSFLGIGKKESDENRVHQILEKKELFSHRFLSSAVSVTLDKNGAIILEKEKKWYRTYTTPVPHASSVGSGDTYTSAFALSLTSGADIYAAAEIASTAASLTANKQHTAWCTVEEIERSLTSFGKYVQNVRTLCRQLDRIRKTGARIVFTNGCFDILHKGHTTYLNKAKQLGDILIVAVNSDESVRKLKGGSRPINALQDRISVLSSLSSIDFLLSFSEDTPRTLLDVIKPDVYVKGGDYKKELLPEREVVEKYGGKIEIIPLVKDTSTTRIVHKITKSVQIPNTSL